MKKFIINSFFMSVLLTIIFIIIELALFLRPNIYSYKYEFANNNAKNIEMLILGNSHLEGSIIPNIIGNNVFNLAISGRRSEYDVEIAKKVVPQMDNLKYLIVPLDYPSFSLGRGNQNEDEESPMDRTYSCMYYKYMGIRMDKPFWYWSEILSSKLKYMVRFLETDSKCRECDSLGVLKMLKNSRLPDWKDRMLPPHIDANKKKNDDKLRLLYEQYSELANIALEKEAKIILLSIPMYKTYQDKMNEVIYGEMIDFATLLCKKYKNVEYLNMTYDKDFISDDFYDSSHLNEYGAEKLSIKLKKVTQ